MKFSLFVSFAFASVIASATPITPAVGQLVELDARASSANCTQYCSPSAGCACVEWPKNCSAFYTVQPGDTCTGIATSFNNLTVTQLYRWNKQVAQTCQSLQAYVPVCINAPGYKFTPPVQPPTGTREAPSKTPVPIMPNIISSCQKFELVAAGTTPAKLAKQNNFPVADFAKWNGNSTTAWTGYWACVKAPTTA